MVNDKIIYVVFFVISLAIVSVVAHIDNSDSLASVEHGVQNTEYASQEDAENETGMILFMLEGHEDDTDNENNGA